MKLFVHEHQIKEYFPPPTFTVTLDISVTKGLHRGIKLKLPTRQPKANFVTQQKSLGRFD